ncbi:hypothetical protein [Croceicoccus sp. BE223]|uniref:hypothetical protein n=1 Tax=Croceicoccus sp. BE223 TaxID=2817716 RepID=UPI002863B718|nr:hypothetical protein [Croceicoccus sp. BE223]MDR7102961.1 hypothetical protein [Croceicoccus sp. BE223]
MNPRAQVAAGGSAKRRPRLLQRRDNRDSPPADLAELVRDFTPQDWRTCLIGAPLLVAVFGCLPFLFLVIEEIAR